MVPCSGCGTAEGRERWFVSWYNGVIQVRKYYCAKCKGTWRCPPFRQVKAIGGTVQRITQSDVERVFEER